MTYSANDINLTQTNDQGNLYVRAKVDRLEQDMQKQTSNLKIYASMYENGSDATFSSKVANGYDDNEKVILSGDVVATRLLIKVKLFFERMS
jgi:lipopolysaccharide export system protein LptC